MAGTTGAHQAEASKFLLLMQEREDIKRRYPMPESLDFRSLMVLDEAEIELVADRVAKVVKGSEALRSNAAARAEWEEQCRLLEAEFAALPPGKPNFGQWSQGIYEVPRRQLATELIQQLQKKIDAPEPPKP